MNAYSIRIVAPVCALSAALLLAALGGAAPSPPPATPARPCPSPNYAKACPNAGFTTALLRDREGALWVGTEGAGLWCRKKDAKEWQWFGIGDLGDDQVLSLCEDRQGRVWVGLGRTGVAVRVGNTWAKYGVFDGPLGEHVYDIAVNPKNGDIWLAHNAGLTRYSEREKRWRHVPVMRAEGISSAEPFCLAFNAMGTLFAGSMEDGLFIAEAKDDYATWRHQNGPERPAEATSGEGLPSREIRDVLVARDGTVFVATDQGLGWSKDQGETFAFVRGKDAPERNKRLQKPLPCTLTKALAELPAEDIIRALAEGDTGKIYLGHWRGGISVWDAEKQVCAQVVTGAGKAKWDNVAAILSVPGEGVLAAHWGLGLVDSGLPFPQAHDIKQIPLPPPSAPVPAGKPSEEEMKAACRALAVEVEKESVGITALPDDWKTQGQWLGRYGTYFANLGAYHSPLDLIWGAGARHVETFAAISPAYEGRDNVRRWAAHYFREDHRFLEFPTPYLDVYRKNGLVGDGAWTRYTCWDDHGEAYSHLDDGPDVVLSMQVPPGTYQLAFYDCNENSHWGTHRAERFRDHRLDVHAHRHAWVHFFEEFYDVEPQYAHTRIPEHWSGVYKRWLVRGPISLTFRLRRRESFNTDISAILFDYPTPRPAPYFESMADYLKRVELETARWQRHPPPTGSDADSLALLLERALRVAPTTYARQARLGWQLLARVERAAKRQTPLLASACFHMGQHTESEAVQNTLRQTTARQVEQNLHWTGKPFGKPNDGFQKPDWRRIEALAEPSALNLFAREPDILAGQASELQVPSPLPPERQKGVLLKP